MALLKFEPPKELAPLRVKIARPVHERVERYREFCGALELADLVERALVYVMDRDPDFRTHENGSASPRAKVERRRGATRVSPADKPAGPLKFLSHPDALLRRAGKCTNANDLRRLHLVVAGEYGFRR